jgi:hypothetical protein
VNVRVQYAHSAAVQGESRGKVHGYGAFAYTAFSAYHRNLVLDFAHSISEELPLFQHLFPERTKRVRICRCVHKNPKLVAVMTVEAN